MPPQTSKEKQNPPHLAKGIHFSELVLIKLFIYLVTHTDTSSALSCSTIRH